MKKQKPIFFLGMFAAFAFSLSPAFSQQWSNPIRLATGGTPDVAIDRNTGEVHVLVMDNKVVHVVLDRNGKKLRQEDVPGSDGPIGRFRFGATIAIDSRSRPHVAFHQHVGNNYYDAYYTYKSGSSWANRLLFSENMWRGYGIRMAIDGDDDVHIIYGVPDVVDAVSATGTYFRIESGNVTHTITDMQKWRIEDHLEVDTFGNSTVHILMSRPDPNGRVYYHTSGNNGNTFTGPINIRNGNDNGRPGNGDLFVDLNGNVHMVYGIGEDAARGIEPAVRYHLRSGGQRIRDIAVTPPGELQPWHFSAGIGTVAASDNGRQVAVAYLLNDGGELRARVSEDQGQTWSPAVSLASQSGCCESRDKPVIRANGRRFYLAYESGGDVWLRWIELGPLPPLAATNGPYSGTEGQIITFNASLSSADGLISQYAWDWNNDGIYDDSTDVPTFDYAYPDDYNGLLTLRVTAQNGAADTSQTSVNISNAPPVISINLNSVAQEGDSTLFLASVTDPGASDTFGNVTWTFGDGQTGIGMNPGNIYADDGVFQVRASVTDDDGATGTANLQLTVQNVPPVADAGGPYVTVLDETINFNGTATDQGVNDIVTLAWDLDNDGVFERNGNQASRAFASTGTFTIRLRATDDDGDSHIDVTQVTVGNGGPIAFAIPSQQVDEGQVFQPIALDNFVADPNNSTAEINWSFFGNTDLIVSISNRQATISTPDADWWGEESIRFVAKDPTGYADTTEAAFIVNPINDPPVLSGIPDQAVIDSSGIFQPVLLDNYVTDVDDPKSALIWNASGYNELFVTVANRVATITRPNKGWFGSEVITFTVRDTSNASDTLSVRFTAKLNNDPPVLAAIPSQTINENESFATIALDQYIDDPDDNPEDISWSLFGNKELNISISIDRLVTIAPPDSEWTKSEHISFVARDPRNNADTTSATFTVLGINDPPLVNELGTYTIDEDDSIFFAIQDLPSYIIDPDHEYEELQYEFVGDSNLRVSFDEQQGLIIFTAADWHGQESAWLRVSDGQAWNIAQINVTARSLPDAPKVFDLLEPVFNQNYLTVPQTIEFVWASTHDPDEGDSLSHYTWQLSAEDDFSTLITSVQNLTDTTITLAANLFLRQPAIFQKIYWRVIATSSDGSSTANHPHQGRITIGIVTDIKDDPQAPVPTQISLLQNYPNPFNPSTQIAFDMPAPGQAKLVIHNMAGHVVRTLASGFYASGRHQLTWDARDDSGREVASGIYIYKLITPHQTLSRKMILMQ